MAYEKNFNKQPGNNESVFSKRIKAGKRRTYFFDVKENRGNDYFITITESKKRFDGDGYDRHKLFIYKEDFMKFIDALSETINHVKTELMPDFDFNAFNHEYDENEERTETKEMIESIEKVAEKTEEVVPQNEPSFIANQEDFSDLDAWKL